MARKSKQTGTEENSVLNNICTPVLLVDKNLDVIFFNDYAVKAYNLNHDDATNGQKLKCYAISHGYDRPCYEYGEKCPIKELLETCDIESAYASHVHFDGLYYKIEAYRNIKDKNSFFEFHIKTTVPELDLESTRKDLKNMSIFKDFFYGNSFPMFLFSPETLAVQYINDAALRFYGYLKDDMVGKPIFETIAPSLKTEKNRKLLSSYVKKAMNRKEGVTYNIKHILKNGESRDIQSVLTIIHVSEKKLLVLSNIIDVTDRIAAETALKESEEQYRSIAETIPEGIYIFSKHIIYSNPAATEILGYTREELSKMKPYQIYTKEFHKLAKEYTERRLRGEKLKSSMTIKAVDRNGKELWLNVQGMTIKYGGRWAGFLTFSDITDKVTYENRLLLKQTELEEQKTRAETVNKYYGALAAANEFMIEKHDRNAVLSKICEIVADINENFFVCIGLWNGVKIQPVAYHSRITGSDKAFNAFVGTNPFIYKDDPLPTRDAFETEKAVIVNDYNGSKYENLATSPFIKAINANAAASFPIRVNAKPIGVLTVFGGKNAFTNDITVLLQTLADNISIKLYLISLEEVEKESKKAMEYMAYHDILTGVANRTHFLNRIKSIESRVKRHKLPLALMLIDLDGFKYINDTYGHDTGDKLLIKVSGRIKESLRNEDEMFRMGGDEFTVITDMSKVESKEDMVNLCERIIDKINEPIIIGENTIRIGASIGLALDLEGGTGFEGIMKMADSAMYRAKNAGKNKCEIIIPDQFAAENI